MEIEKEVKKVSLGLGGGDALYKGAPTVGQVARKSYGRHSTRLFLRLCVWVDSLITEFTEYLGSVKKQQQSVTTSMCPGYTVVSLFSFLP